MGISVDSLRESSDLAYNQSLELKKEHKKQEQELKNLYEELEHKHGLAAHAETIKLIGAALGLVNAFCYQTDASGKELVTQFNQLLSSTGAVANTTSDVFKSYNQQSIQKINGELDLLKQLMADVDKNREQAVDSIRRIDRMVHEIISRDQEIAKAILR